MLSYIWNIVSLEIISLWSDCAEAEQHWVPQKVPSTKLRSCYRQLAGRARGRRGQNSKACGLDISGIAEWLGSVCCNLV